MHVIFGLGGALLFKDGAIQILVRVFRYIKVKLNHNAEKEKREREERRGKKRINTKKLTRLASQPDTSRVKVNARWFTYNYAAVKRSNLKKKKKKKICCLMLGL